MNFNKDYVIRCKECGDSDCLPHFNSQEEFEEYFKPHNEVTKPLRNSSGVLVIKSEEEFNTMLNKLFEIENMERVR